MAQKLSPTQKALLDMLPADLPAEEFERLRAFLEAYFSKAKESTVSDLVQESSAHYTRTKSNDDTIQLSIPRAWLDDAWLAKLLNWIEMKKLTDKNQMSEEQALEMGKASKKDWWAENQDWLLEKIGEK